MTDTVKCVSTHAEDLVVGVGDDADTVTVPVGETQRNVDLENAHNARLLADRAIIIVDAPAETPEPTERERLIAELRALGHEGDPPSQITKLRDLLAEVKKTKEAGQ